MAHRPNPTMSDEIVGCILPYIQDGQDRAAISLVCKQWYDLDSLTRRHVSVPLSYVIRPQRLLRRFPNIESLKLKGKPRAAMFDLMHGDWGGYVAPWVEIFQSLPKLKSIHFRRGFVTSHDLETIASVIGPRLMRLKLEHCLGFSTKGLKAIARECRNLKTLCLDQNQITDKNDDWLHELALHNNKALETLKFFKTSLTNIAIKDLEFLARKCPLTCVSVNNIDVKHLQDFFRMVPKLREFSGGSLNAKHNYDNFALPDQLASLNLTSFQRCHMPMVIPVVNSLEKLDLRHSSIGHEGHCDIISRCHKLQILETSNCIGDVGLETVALHCKSLKRLRIEERADRRGVVTQRGLKAIAEGCRELQYLNAHVNDMTNETLARIGENLKDLNDFRLVMWNLTCADFPLDDGVRLLLQGCTNLRRFALKLNPGGLTDIGLRYIGQYGQKFKSMILGGLGENDAALIALSMGCPSLKKLEIKDCSFTAHGLAFAASQLTSLRYMWIHGFKLSSDDNKVFQEMSRPHWSCEIILRQGLELILQHQSVDSPFPPHVFGYASLDGPRTDQPGLLVYSLTRTTTGDAPRNNRLQRTSWRKHEKEDD